MAALPRIIVIVGPTASGKTALGIEAAQYYNGVVISADSRQIYSHLNIGTAKPSSAFADEVHSLTTPDVVTNVPHYLLNIIPPTETFSLAQWQTGAYQVIEAVLAEEKTPFVVGGTMLYVDSLLYNYTIPAVPPNPALRAELEQQPAEALYQQLLTQDPAAQEFIEPGNVRRIIRALEVMAATGQPFSTVRAQHTPRYNFQIVGLFPGWETLQNNITKRAEAMLAEGLVAEVQALHTRFSPTLPLLQTLNYKQVGQHLDGELTSAELLEKIVSANVRYAHRQMSWWKNNQAIRWHTEAPAALETIKKMLSA